MGRIRILSDQVANQIAAGEVVDRPASVVKELLENSLDAGASRIRVEVEAGGRRLIRIADDGCGMNRDDALLAFERHATSKLRSVDDLLAIATLGFRGEALPSIASVARVTLETAPGPQSDGGMDGSPDGLGTRIEIAGGKILSIADTAQSRGTTIAVADLFFNTPARRKFLRAESTELAHVTALVTHYALVHPEKHFELLSATHTLLSAPPVSRTAERIYQIFGKETLGQLLPVAAETPLARAGLPEPPPWKRDPDEPARDPGSLRLSGFYSKPELQKLNRNSIYIFVNKRLIRDRLLLHAITEAYRNVIPPTSFPVVLLFLELPPEEVDVNVHPAKTEVRFRQQTLVHDFVRDSLRMALVKARPAAGFPAALGAQPTASPSLMPPTASPLPGPVRTEFVPAGGGHPDSEAGLHDEIDPAHGPERQEPQVAESERLSSEAAQADAEPFRLTERRPSPAPGNLPFADRDGVPAFAGGLGVAELAGALGSASTQVLVTDGGCAPGAGSSHPIDPATETARVEAERAAANLNHLGSLRPMGQLRDSFILATGQDGLWIIDQHVAHERVLFEKILRQRQVEQVQRQRLLMPLLVDLRPDQMVVFAAIADELERNGFEVEPFGPQTLAVKAAPAGLEGAALERMLAEVIEQSGSEAELAERKEDMQTLRRRIAASIACHSAIKVNTPLDPARMEWLLLELARTSHPTSCPHGRPIALLYSWDMIQRAFHRI
jgi:DNA mismatch repair protein MutL